jgi:hypothetical protein
MKRPVLLLLLLYLQSTISYVYILSALDFLNMDFKCASSPSL